MVAFTVSDGTTTYPLAEMEIKFTGTELDEAQFVIAGVYALNATVTIYADATVQFIGYVKDIEEVEQGALYKYTAYEKAVELKTQPYLSGGLDIFTKTSTTVNALALDMLTSTPDSGWTISTGSSGYPDTTAIASMNFYLVNRLQGINKILREIRGYFVLFDSSAKTVKYLNATGINTDRSASNLVYTSKRLISSSMLRGITQVTVIGKDSSIRGDYGTSTSSRAYYQVDDIETNDEALKIATAIFGDIGVTYADYEVEVDPTQIQYDVRDKVKVDGSYFWITKVIQGMETIVLTLDDGRTSVIDSFGKRIHVIEGNFPEGSDNSWSGGNSNVGANGAIETTYIFDVKDATVISNAALDVVISQFDKNTDVGITTEYLSAPAAVSTQGAATDVTTFGKIIYMPDSGGLACGTYTNGFQMGVCSIDLNILGDANDQVRAMIQCKHPSDSTWHDLSYMSLYVTTSWQHFILAFMFSGDDTADGAGTTGFRVKLYDADASPINLKMSTSYVGFSTIPRHVHSITTAYNKVTAANTPAATVFVKLNSGGTYTEVTPGTPVALTTLGTLATGKNTIYIKTPATSTTNMCSVNPTITYQSLKS